MLFPLAMLSQYIFGPLLFLLSVFIILIILLQRGRGGGLTGALGGAGGASAFGVKAGDIFTRITAISVLFWIILNALTCYWYLPDKLDFQADPGSMSSGSSTSGSSDLGEMGLSEDISKAIPALTNDTPAKSDLQPQTPAALPPTELQLPPAVNEIPETSTKPEEEMPATSGLTETPAAATTVETPVAPPADAPAGDINPK